MENLPINWLLMKLSKFPPLLEIKPIVQVYVVLTHGELGFDSALAARPRLQVAGGLPAAHEHGLAEAGDGLAPHATRDGPRLART